MWQGICTFLCTFYACMTSFLNLFSAVRQCLLAVPTDRRTPFSLFYSPFSRITCISHKNICLPSRSCLPIILPYRYIFATTSSQRSFSPVSNISQSNPYRSLFPVHCLSISFHSSGYLLARSTSISTPLYISSAFFCFII